MIGVSSHTPLSGEGGQNPTTRPPRVGSVSPAPSRASGWHHPLMIRDQAALGLIATRDSGHVSPRRRIQSRGLPGPPGGRQTIICPPLTLMPWPVMKSASLDTRNATSAATSSAVPSLPRGMRHSLAASSLNCSYDSSGFFCW